MLFFRNELMSCLLRMFNFVMINMFLNRRCIDLRLLMLNLLRRMLILRERIRIFLVILKYNNLKKIKVIIFLY